MTKQVELPEPLFWYRPIGKDGLYEGPTHSASVGGKMWREEKPDEWEGLFTADQMRQFREEGVREAKAESEKMIDALLAHCDDPECFTCGKIICPHSEPLHFHHDGCPACAEHDAAQSQAKGESDLRDKK